MGTEKRLIDFEKARKKVMEILAGKVSTPIAVKVAIAMQEAAVDAVEVVRCKDCRFWIHTGNGIGDCTNRRFHLDDCPDPAMRAEEFCCLGERKDND